MVPAPYSPPNAVSPSIARHAVSVGCSAISLSTISRSREGNALSSRSRCSSRVLPKGGDSSFVAAISAFSRSNNCSASSSGGPPRARRCRSTASTSTRPARSGVARNRKTLAHSRKATPAAQRVSNALLACDVPPRVSKRPSPVLFVSRYRAGRAFRACPRDATVPLVLLTMRVIEAMRLRCWRVGRLC